MRILAPPADLSASAVAPALKMNGAAAKKPPKKAAPLFAAPKPWKANEEPAMPVIHVALDLIHPSPHNPRTDFTGAAMDELVETIRERGVIQPITVRARAEGGYEIIAGERRWRASKIAKRTTIPIIVRDDLDDTAAAELQAIENLTRADLSAIEEATGYKTLLALPGYSMDRLENVTGKKRNTIYGKLKLLDCPEEVRMAVAGGKLADTVAEMIGRLKGDAQEKAAKEILHPTGYVQEKGKPLSHHLAERVIENIKAEEKSKVERQEAVDALSGMGLDVLDAEETSKIWQGHGALKGHVFADEVCPRDPKNRKWKTILKGNQDVAQLAIVTNEWSDGKRAWRPREIYRLQEANDALKAMGIWDADGSKKALEREEKRQAKAAEAAHAAKIQEGVDEVARLAESNGTRVLRPLIELAISGLLMQASHARAFVGKRHGLTEDYPSASKFEPIVKEMTLGQTLGCLAELSVCALTHYGAPDESTLKEAVALLRGEGSADVRTEEAP